jgi:Pentapeptide repeats (8 copies)
MNFRKIGRKTWVYVGLSIIALLIVGGFGASLMSWGDQVLQDWGSLHRSQSSQVSEKDKFNASLAIAQAIISGVGTVATIVGVLFLWLNFKLTESRLVTERFSKAIEQLGSEKMEVRLGAIYSLERLAKDSAVDHWTVIEVLTSFIREKASLQLCSQRLEENSITKQPKVATDVQAALTVIGRRDESKDPEGQTVDLIQTALNRANLVNASLSNAYLFNADLRSADLRNADFHSASLRRACLQGSLLVGADLSNAFLVEADLSNALLTGANLDGTHFSETKGLTPEQVKQAKNWEKAFYDEEFCQELGLPPESKEHRLTRFNALFHRRNKRLRVKKSWRR